MQPITLEKENLGEFQEVVDQLDTGVLPENDMRNIVSNIIIRIFDNFNTYQFSPNFLDGYLSMLKMFPFVTLDESHVYTMEIDDKLFISLKLEESGKISEFTLQQYMGLSVNRRLHIVNGINVQIELGEPELD